MIHSIKTECLEHFVPISEAHLDDPVAEYAAHVHDERPHQGLGACLVRETGPPRHLVGRIVCSKRLGAVLRDYYRVAA